MNVIGNRSVGLVLFLVGVVAVGFFLFSTPAEAHGAHLTSVEAVEAEIVVDHDAHGHLGHCHGGAFCPAAAVVSLTPVGPEPMVRSTRFGRPESSTADTAPTSFDPPPPRFLI